MLDAFLAHVRHLERILRGRGRTREETEDLIQETFIRVKKYLDEGGEIREPQAFLVTTALNLSRDAREREHRNLYSQRTLEDLVQLPDVRPMPDEVLAAQQRLARLSNALNRAGPRAREVFLMSRVHGMTYPQIAAHFQLSVSAIEKYMARALVVLGEELAE